MAKVNLEEKFGFIDSHYDPKIVGQLNGQHVKLVKFQGPFVWHVHENEDEMFFVVKGEMAIHFRDRVEQVGPGEFIIVERGVEHKPDAPDEVWAMLFEPAGTLNTGDAGGEMTKENPEWI